ncbi:hypothetical protein [Streptomyces mirabilis]|uniref:hypothetical protein n=1 Tax=Streptomyces mirabilis TaxID=68239 RepID=UPI00369F9155
MKAAERDEATAKPFAQVNTPTGPGAPQLPKLMTLWVAVLLGGGLASVADE